MPPTRLHIDLGNDEKGQRRWDALTQLATAANHHWGGSPSPGRLISALADAQLYYAIAIDTLNNPNAHTIIRFHTQPARKNMSREQCVEGWLGTTDDIDKAALGLHTPASARALLRSHGVKIPQTIPVRHSVPYRTGGDPEAESLNKRDAYPWPGPWAGVPDAEIRWCQRPLRAIETKILDHSEPGFPPHFEIILTADEKLTLNTRDWYTVNNHWDNKTDAQRYAQALLDKIFDAASLIGV